MRQLALGSFQLQNFKAVRNSTTIRFGPLTVLVGNNGSGKSSLIEGVETFRAVVLSGLDVAMNRWRGFEHVWNHAAPHALQRSAAARACHTDPLEFHATGYSEETKYDALSGFSRTHRTGDLRLTDHLWNGRVRTIMTAKPL